MTELDFTTSSNSPISLALGFFDCIHVGHRALIGAMKSYSEALGLRSALLTFKNDISERFGGEKQIYTYAERLAVLKESGIDYIIAANFDDEFENLSPAQFFEQLTTRYDIKAIFVGPDYTFGKGATGDVKLLGELCRDRGIQLHIVPFETADGKKISTTRLKNLVKGGDIARLNALLGAPYVIEGRVTSDRHVGRSLGFPTANIPVREDKLTLKSGIYATTLTVDGTTYGAMTNIGAKPTFDDCVPTIETYAFDFDGDLYGKDVLLRVYARTRDIKKFASPEALKAQLERDEAHIKALLKQKL